MGGSSAGGGSVGGSSGGGSGGSVGGGGCVVGGGPPDGGGGCVDGGPEPPPPPPGGLPGSTPGGSTPEPEPEPEPEPDPDPDPDPGSVPDAGSENGLGTSETPPSLMEPPLKTRAGRPRGEDGTSSRPGSSDSGGSTVLLSTSMPAAPAAVVTLWRAAGHRATPASPTATSAAADRHTFMARRSAGRRQVARTTPQTARPPIVTSSANVSASARMERSSVDMRVLVGCGGRRRGTGRR